MEEQTKTTKAMRIALIVLLGLVIVAGITATVFYASSSQEIDASVYENAQMVDGEAFHDNIPAGDAVSPDSSPTEEAAPF